MKKIILLFFILSVMVIFYFLWSRNILSDLNSASTPTVDKIRERGSLIVGSDVTYPPLEFVDDQGETSGFDVELAKLIASDLKVKLIIKNVRFDELFTALKKGEIDMIISSVTITNERIKEFAFSTPYINVGQSIIVPIDNKSITDVVDLKDKRVGVQSGTTSEIEAKKATTKVVLYPDYLNANNELLLKNIDAIIIDYPAAVSMVDKNKNRLKIVGKPFTSEFYGIVMDKSKTDLKQKVDETIAKLIREGKLRELEFQWFHQ